MRRISIEGLSPPLLAVALASLALLAGCATRKDAVLPHGDATMRDLWNQYSEGAAGDAQANRALVQAREVLRRPLSGEPVRYASYTRTTESETNNEFKRLPDPDLLMYVFPHLAGTDPVPVPGYCTVFSFYEHVHYAMPGERTEPY